jgi:hypothetical protein
VLGTCCLDGLRMSLEAGPLDLMAAIQFDTMTASSCEKPHRLAIDMERNSPQQGVSSDPLAGLEVLATLGSAGRIARLAPFELPGFRGLAQPTS